MTYIALSFFFACFYFAMFYLQLINQNGQWKPAGIDHPPSWMGVSETALILLAGLAYFWAQWGGLYARKTERLTLGLWVAAVLSVVSCIIHIVELHAPGFSLQGGGYVSVFIATEGTFTILLILSTLVLLGVANRARVGLFGAVGNRGRSFWRIFWLVDGNRAGELPGAVRPAVHSDGITPWVGRQCSGSGPSIPRLW